MWQKGRALGAQYNLPDLLSEDMQQPAEITSNESNGDQLGIEKPYGAPRIDTTRTLNIRSEMVFKPATELVNNSRNASEIEPCEVSSKCQDRKVKLDYNFHDSRN